WLGHFDLRALKVDYISLQFGLVFSFFVRRVAFRYRYNTPGNCIASLEVVRKVETDLTLRRVEDHCLQTAGSLDLGLFSVGRILLRLVLSKIHRLKEKIYFPCVRLSVEKIEVVRLYKKARIPHRNRVKLTLIAGADSDLM